MIEGFRDRRTEDVFNGICPKGFPADIFRVAWRKLRMIDAAADIKDLASPPGNRLHRLTGDRQGQHAIRINDRWRICFEWSSGNARNVEITDYH